MATGQKKARRLNASLVFVDESGILMAPILRRTWSRSGHTPVIRQRTRSHQKVSMIAALCVNARRSRLHLCFRLHPNVNIASGEVIQFVRQLCRHLRGPIVLLWDRFNPHRSAKTRKALAKKSRLHVVFFPPYAPELNPTENVWAYLKTNPLANTAPHDLPTLTTLTRGSSRSVQRSPSLLRGFLRHTPLSLRLG